MFVGKRKGVGGGAEVRWIITFADLITLLFCFFVYLSLFTKPQVSIKGQFKVTEPVLSSLQAFLPTDALGQIRKLMGATYEIEAEYMHEFLRNRSKGFAYTPIVASGNNANVLHYIENNQQCKAGDLILMDVGAEYANYSSDMTRTIPVSGTFTARQKEVYNAVLNVKKEATKMLVPGTMWKEYHVEVGKLMTSELLQLGLLDKADVQNENPDWPAYKKYFMHGTSHHIGLDTHDYGILWEPMKANMVFTVEPGIYIPEEGFGIRLEDDEVIQEQGEPFNLMRNIPLEAEEIEDLMNS